MRRVDHVPDLAETAALQRRRFRELQRQSRVFDARTRTIGVKHGQSEPTWALLEDGARGATKRRSRGVDLEGLDAQVNDKRIRDATERAWDATIAAEMKQNDKIMCILDQRQKKDALNIKKAVHEFHQTFQQPETRREFDLSDPQALKKDTPARMADNDPRCTVSGLQKFMGEDLNSVNRKRYQQEQAREWLLEQQKDWTNALADRKYADGLHDAHRLDLDQKAMDLQRADEETRRAVCAATKEFNRSQAIESGEKKKLEKQQELEDNAAEISSTLRGDLLSENPQQATSSFAPHRVITDRWKGMNQDQLKEIRDVQLQQVLEKLRLEEEERQRNAEWDRQRIQAARAELLFERHQQRQNRELRRALDNSNAQLFQDQKSRRAFLDEAVYANFPSGQYYTQFNTDSR